MTIHNKSSSYIPVGSSLALALAGELPSADEAACFESLQPAGYTLFRRNLSNNPEQIRALTRSLRQLSRHHPPLIAIDQEGGRVARLKAPCPDRGPAMGVAPGIHEESLRTLTDYGLELAQYLTSLGINVDFAPVCDVLTNEQNTAIGDRAFAKTTEEVVLRSAAFLKGLTGGGVLGCLKHFPGQGSAPYDTHLASAVIADRKDDFRRVHLSAFQPHIHESPMVMLSHCIYPFWDDRPASLSRTIIQNVLRRDLGYQGITVSDDMNMKALPQDARQWQDAIIQAIRAGINLVLVCEDLEKCQLAAEALTKEAERDNEFRALIHHNHKAINKLRQQLQS